MTKIIQRHDTAANWTAVNPVLAAGEIGVETDTNKFKFGDGTTAWSSLAYAAGEIPIEYEFNKDVFQIVGSPSITNEGIASNFSASNYVRIQMPNLSTANSWEIYGQFTSGSSYAKSNKAYICASSESNPVLAFNVMGPEHGNTGHMGIGVGNSGGDSWVFTESKTISTSKIELITVYNYKIIFTGTAYQLWLAKEGESYTKEIEYSSSEKISYNSSYNFNIGVSRLADDKYVWLGSINLSKFKIISDGNIIFNGSKKIEKISGQDVKTFTGYSDTGTLVLKSINGVLQWVAEA